MNLKNLVRVGYSGWEEWANFWLVGRTSPHPQGKENPATMENPGRKALSNFIENRLGSHKKELGSWNKKKSSNSYAKYLVNLNTDHLVWLIPNKVCLATRFP